MPDSLIDQHKRIAMGEDVDVGGGCEPAFGKGRKIHDDGSAKMKHRPDGKRGLAPGEKHADHGPHDMHPLDYHD